jgi:outer membrane receptor protein involved in Fe transport
MNMARAPLTSAVWEDVWMRDYLAATALLALVAATPALAQTAPGDSKSSDTPAPTSSSAQPETTSREGDIIVTARKRAESIRDIPGTISAVTVDQLDDRGPITGTGDLLNSVPGVRFNDVSSSNLSEISIRGSGPSARPAPIRASASSSTALMSAAARSAGATSRRSTISICPVSKFWKGHKARSMDATRNLAL